jgi:potassium/hydrogen antiporter
MGSGLPTRPAGSVAVTEGLPVDNLILVAGGLLLIGILLIGVSDRLRVPAALLSLGVGMLFGSDGLGVVDIGDFELVRNISVIALVIILFEGGLTTKPSAIREAGLPGFVLSTVGVLITALVTAVGVEMLFGLGWTTSFLLGAVVASTDAAVVFELVKRAPLPRRLASILEVESGANDPFAIVLTLGLLAIFEESGIRRSRRLDRGGSVAAGGRPGGWTRWWDLASKRILELRLRSEGLYPILAAALAGLSYGTAAAIGASGFLAVYVTGLVIGAAVPLHRRVIRTFHASLATGADIGLFLLLGCSSSRLSYPVWRCRRSR